MILLGDKTVDFRLGDAVVPKIYRGDDVAWSRNVVHFQQLVDFVGCDALTERGTVATKDYATNEFVINGTISTQSGYANFMRQTNQNFPAYHTMLRIDTGASISFRTEQNSEVEFWIYRNNPLVRNSTPAAGIYGRLYSSDHPGQLTNHRVQFMIFDLTAMFSDCPELMPTTVEEFKKLFPATYYPYTSEPYDVYI